MTQIFKILSNKKLPLFFLFYLILVLPTLIFFVANNMSFEQKLYLLAVNVVLYLVVAFMSTFINPRIEKIIYYILFFVALGPGLVYMGYLLFAQVLLESNSIISLFETNPDESKEFMTHYFNKWLILGQSLYILFFIVIIWKMKPYKRLKIRKNKTLFYSSLSILILLFSIPVLSKHIYFFNFYKTFADYRSNLSYEQNTIKDRQDEAYTVESLFIDTVPKTIVVVIGESLNRNHMSLYGYNRETSPLLSALNDSLFVFKDVVSPQVHTIPVLRAATTLSSIENSENVVAKPSLFELFNRAGYETHFITNQRFAGAVPTSYDAFFKLAENKYNVSIQKQPDEVIMKPFKTILENKSAQNRLIVIHLIGNHMAYEFRYTPAFSVFLNNKDHKIADAPYRNKDAKLMIDRYDNSVLYNDFVIAELIRELKEDSSSDAGLIYFSDHGEELYDNRKFAGHAYEKVSTYMCEVPFLVWMSEGYKTKRNDLVIDTERPFSTGDFLYSLSDFAGLSYVDYIDSLSLFSDKYAKPVRYVGKLTYDEVKAITQARNAE